MLLEKTIQEYADLMSSDYGALGGGGASALAGSLGAALTAMVGTLTLGRKKYEADQALAETAQAQGYRIKDEFLAVMERDTVAFDEVTSVFSMPRDTVEQQNARNEAMQMALRHCTQTPLEMMALCVEVLRDTASLVGHSNVSCASDLGCAALQLECSVRGAWLNVLINLRGICDVKFVAQQREKGEALLTLAQNYSQDIYESVLQSLA